MIWRSGRSGERRRGATPRLSLPAPAFALDEMAFGKARARRRAATTGEFGHEPHQRRYRRLFRHGQSRLRAQVENNSGGIRAAACGREAQGATALLRRFRVVAGGGPPPPPPPDN